MKLVSTGILLFFVLSNILSQQHQGASREDENSCYVLIPVRVKNTAISKLIEEATPKKLKLDNSSKTQKYSLDFHLTDEKTSFHKNTITHYLKITKGSGSYGTRPCWSNSFSTDCGPWVNFNCSNFVAKSSVEVKVDIHDDFTLNTKSKLNLELIDAVCQGVNITSALKTFGWNKFENDISKEIDQELGKLNFKSSIESIWKEIQKPIQLDSSLYLLINPKNLVYKDFYFDESYLHLGIGMHFTATTGNESDAKNWNPRRTLPKLEKVYSYPKSNLEVNVPVKLDFETIELKAKEALVNQKIRAVNKRGKEKVYGTILDASVTQSSLEDFDLKFGLDMKMRSRLFKKKGNIILHANIDYSKENSLLFVDQFKLDASSNNWLIKNTLETLANVLVYNRIKKMLVFDVEKELSKQKKAINDKLNNKMELFDGIQLSGSVNELSMHTIQSSSNALYMTFYLKGNISMQIDRLNF